jgi:hypothetical protein
MADPENSGRDPLTQFSITEPTPGYWSVDFSHR